MSDQVLLIEDDDALRMSLAQTLSLEGVSVIQANGFDQARRTIRANFAGIVLSDMRMPQKNGFDVLDYVKAVDTELPVVFLTGEADVPMALRAMKEGAYDFLEKPCSTDELLKVLKHALNYRNKVRQTRSLERALNNSDMASVNFPGKSAAVTELRATLRKIAPLRAHVLFYGDAGAGKKLAAYTTHSQSPECNALLSINFSYAPKDVLDDFTVPEGLVDLTLKNLHLARAQQQEQILDMIATHPDLRVFFSSPFPLEELFQQGLHTGFAPLQMIPVKVPNFKERKQDLPVLAESLMRQYARSISVDMPEVPTSVYAEIMAKEWAGNLNEMREYVRSIVLGLSIQKPDSETLTLAQQMEAFEKLILVETLKRNKGKATESAIALGLPRKTFYDHLARFDLRPKDFKRG